MNTLFTFFDLDGDDFEDLLAHMDSDNSGSVNYQEFIRGIEKAAMGDIRMQMTNMKVLLHRLIRLFRQAHENNKKEASTLSESQSTGKPSPQNLLQTCDDSVSGANLLTLKMATVEFGCPAPVVEENVDKCEDRTAAMESKTMLDQLHDERRNLRAHLDEKEMCLVESRESQCRLEQTCRQLVAEREHLYSENSLLKQLTSEADGRLRWEHGARESAEQQCNLLKHRCDELEGQSKEFGNFCEQARRHIRELAQPGQLDEKHSRQWEQLQSYQKSLQFGLTQHAGFSGTPAVLRNLAGVCAHQDSQATCPVHVQRVCREPGNYACNLSQTPGGA